MSNRFLLLETPSFSTPATREQDLKAFSRSWEDMRIKFLGLKDVLIRGRKVNRTPSSSADVVAGDVEGDVSFSASYMYVLIDNGGTLEWRRVALTSW